MFHYHLRGACGACGARRMRRLSRSACRAGFGNIFRGVILQAMAPEFGLGQPQFRNRVAPVGMAPAVFVPGARLIDLRADIDVVAASCILHKRACQPAHCVVDLDDRAAPVIRLERDLAALDDSPVDRIGHRGEAQLVPVSFDPPELGSGASATRSTGREGGLRRARSRAFSSGRQSVRFRMLSRSST
jgi:hypothetical protein